MARGLDEQLLERVVGTGSPRGHLFEHAYSEVSRRIVSLALAPGEAFTEGELARRLGLSKTPVREALLALRQMGLVDAHAGAGYTVSPVNDVEGLWRCLAMAEREAATYTGPVAPDKGVVGPAEFLKRLFACSLSDYSEAAVSTYVAFALAGPVIVTSVVGNEYLGRFVSHLHPNLMRSMHLALRVLQAEGTFPPPVDDGDMVLAALTGDAETARRLLAVRAEERPWVVEVLSRRQ